MKRIFLLFFFCEKRWIFFFIFPFWWWMSCRVQCEKKIIDLFFFFGSNYTIHLILIKLRRGSITRSIKTGKNFVYFLSFSFISFSFSFKNNYVQNVFTAMRFVLVWTLLLKGCWFDDILHEIARIPIWSNKLGTKTIRIHSDNDDDK